jgi:hypothetical protein
MKWVREDKVWYSEDVIKKIKKLCEDKPKETIEKVLELIEREG